LVPGPEKMPFKRLLSPIQEVAFDLGGTVGSLGLDDDRKVFYSKDQQSVAAPLICYESIYGGFVAEFVRNGANILMVITNDGWWGNTAGHKQHLAYARLRAVECRRSIARSANTGISGFVTQRGDLIEATPYWVQDARKAILKTNNEITLFVKFGDFAGRISVFLTALLFLISLTIFFKKKSRHHAN
jgi:apolipoprotein N-acyltransferase